MGVLSGMDAFERVGKERTLLDTERLWTLCRAAMNTDQLAGEVAEVGVARGGSAAFLAMVCPVSEVHVFDTFTGHPPTSITHRDGVMHKPGNFKTDIDDVRAYLAQFPSVVVHPGDITQTLAHEPERLYRLVHLDTDLYMPTLTALRYFSGRMVPGGVVVVDDAGAPSCPGVDAAVSAIVDLALWQCWHLTTEQCLLVKR